MEIFNLYFTFWKQEVHFFNRELENYKLEIIVIKEILRLVLFFFMNSMDTLTIISKKFLLIPPDSSFFSIPSLRSPFKNVNITILQDIIRIL